MLRTLALLAATMVATLAFEAQPARGGIVSPGNPSKSFNISGINYGSMKWEQDHGNRRSLFPGRRRANWRRW
jgi:hypothetical protein